MNARQSSLNILQSKLPGNNILHTSLRAHQDSNKTNEAITAKENSTSSSFHKIGALENHEVLGYVDLICNLPQQVQLAIKDPGDMDARIDTSVYRKN